MLHLCTQFSEFKEFTSTEMQHLCTRMTTSVHTVFEPKRIMREKATVFFTVWYAKTVKEKTMVVRASESEDEMNDRG